MDREWYDEEALSQDRVMCSRLLERSEARIKSVRLVSTIVGGMLDRCEVWSMCREVLSEVVCQMMSKMSQETAYSASKVPEKVPAGPCIIAGGRVLPTSLFERPGLKKLTRRKHSSPRPNRQQARRDEGCPDQAQGVTSLIAMFGGGVKTDSSDKNQVRQLSAS